MTSLKPITIATFMIKLGLNGEIHVAVKWVKLCSSHVNKAKRGFFDEILDASSIFKDAINYSRQNTFDDIHLCPQQDHAHLILSVEHVGRVQLQTGDVELQYVVFIESQREIRRDI